MKIPAVEVAVGSTIGHRGIVYHVNSLNHLASPDDPDTTVTVVFYVRQESNRESHVLSVPAQHQIHVREVAKI